MSWSNRNGNYWQSGVSLTLVEETATYVTLRYTALFRSNYRINVKGSIYWDMSIGGAASWSYSSGGSAEDRYIESENDASVTLGTHDFTVYKTTSAQTVTAYNTVRVTSVSSGTQTASDSYTVPALATYTIWYNANGGVGAPGSQTENYGYALYISSTAPTRTGYTFQGWNTEANGSGTWYYANNYYYNNATSVTLYAQWTPNTLTVNYYTNINNVTVGEYENAYTGTHATSTKILTYTFYYDSSYPYGLNDIPMTAPGWTRNGYWISEYNKYVHQSTGFDSGQALAQALGTDISSGNKAVVVYASWDRNTYTITYDANGGSGSMNSQIVNWDEEFTFYANEFKREGGTFIGWHLYRNDDNKWFAKNVGWKTIIEIVDNGYEKQVYPDKGVYSLDNTWIAGCEDARNFTLYAVWETPALVEIDVELLYQIPKLNENGDFAGEVDIFTSPYYSKLMTPTKSGIKGNVKIYYKGTGDNLYYVYLQMSTSEDFNEYSTVSELIDMRGGQVDLIYDGNYIASFHDYNSLLNLFANEDAKSLYCRLYIRYAYDNGPPDYHSEEHYSNIVILKPLTPVKLYKNSDWENCIMFTYSNNSWHAGNLKQINTPSVVEIDEPQTIYL